MKKERKQNDIINPLVSIIVISYNSAEYVLETLESAKAQTYQNIELIVSDDGSNDNTTEICQNWIEINSIRFVRSEVINASKNTGLPGNCNRGIKSATGSWIKLIAGDDILLPNCIKDNIGFIVSHTDKVEVVQSNSKYYRSYFTEENYLHTRNVLKEPLSKNQKSSDYQKKILLWAPSVNAPTIFLRKDLIERLGYYDESIKFMEDWPMWLKMNESGVRIFSLSKVTVAYRMNSASSSNENTDIKIYSSIYKKLKEFAGENTYPKLCLMDIIMKKYEYYIRLSLDTLGLNRNILICKAIFLSLLTPFRFYTKIRTYFYLIIFK